MMRNYTAAAYEQLVENSQDATLQSYMKDEQLFLASVNNANERTFVDLGAGNGRVEKFLSGIAGDVVAIELNPDMYGKLAERADELTNVRVVNGDFMRLAEILPAFIHHPVFLLLQNTLGTVEGGSAEQILGIVRQLASQRQGSLVLSLLRQPALQNWGTSMYRQQAAMVGNIDTQKTDFANGLFVSDTGYTSKWWTDAEITNLKQLGQLVRENYSQAYAFLELAFAA